MHLLIADYIDTRYKRWMDMRSSQNISILLFLFLGVI